MTKVSSGPHDPASDADNTAATAVSRRSLLLGGAALAATTALVSTPSVRTAQAQSGGSLRQQAQHPRHLRRRHRHRQHQRLFERPDGLPDAEHRQHRRDGIKFLHYYARAILHRGTLEFPHRPARHPHRLDEGGLPRRADGHEPARPVGRRPAEESRLRHRAVRQEPCRRPQPVAADRQRLRRVFRQPLPP